eukprot:CAMPEP_0176220930 /NCGR_PEP_ID=MMETSP0121_2-20121125/19468_1 /TAXON_ID=160619 /ORGANISM="Kryptoperidinium foliaceum, Strain CCMP 1326" /LENGTH=281 /DNA_ID=CAMNT_0017560119 /DNA_START=26 /DNA_END=867 /DNA_ORIENTATION=-
MNEGGGCGGCGREGGMPVETSSCNVPPPLHLQAIAQTVLGRASGNGGSLKILRCRARRRGRELCRPSIISCVGDVLGVSATGQPGSKPLATDPRKRSPTPPSCRRAFCTHTHASRLLSDLRAAGPCMPYHASTSSAAPPSSAAILRCIRPSKTGHRLPATADTARNKIKSSWYACSRASAIAFTFSRLAMPSFFLHPDAWGMWQNLQSVPYEHPRALKTKAHMVHDPLIVSSTLGTTTRRAQASLDVDGGGATGPLCGGGGAGRGASAFRAGVELQLLLLL